MPVADPGRARIVQPLPAPVYHREYRELLATGALVDRSGLPLPSGPCPTCDSLIDGYTCPGAIRCPRCSATGRRCLRPSGHESDQWHKARRAAADDLDRQREDANDPTLPAPWP
ncbi:hypothetical protein [Kitasatospora purpeofusca]|uniref:hypothetical protein n=1 Tax=Kitasatospora purpeofusca TaxID=67352 RepID=UPI0036B874A2